jgi:hypothetical protein
MKDVINGLVTAILNNYLKKTTMTITSVNDLTGKKWLKL